MPRSPKNQNQTRRTELTVGPGSPHDQGPRQQRGLAAHGAPSRVSRPLPTPLVGVLFSLPRPGNREDPVLDMWRPFSRLSTSRCLSRHLPWPVRGPTLRA